MALLNRHKDYWTTTTAVTGTYWDNHYNYNIYSDYLLYNGGRILGIDPAAPAAKPKKSSFENKLQDEIDSWLDIFKEN